MSKKVSLQEIIESVLGDKGVEYDIANDSTVRSLQRAFDRLIEKLGSDKEVLKHGGRNIEFEESEIPFMKVLISQLYDGRGLIGEFANDGNRNRLFSSKDVRELIQSLIDEAEKTGMSEYELKEIAKFFDNIFLYSHKRTIEYCHELIDALAMNLVEFPISIQSLYVNKLEHILKKEFALRIAESATNILEIADIINSTKKEAGDNIGIQSYSEFDPEIRFEYINRDKRVLKRIQEDDDLRQYIEKKIGRKAEEIFNYASLEN